VLRDGDEIRQAFANAGWTLKHLHENALRIEGREYDLTSVTAARDDLRASGYVLRDFDDGDPADRWITHGAIRTRTIRREGRVKVSFEVYDFGRASAELRKLLPLVDQGDFLRAIVDALAARGWHVLDDGRSASADWDFSWQVTAEREGDAIAVGVRFCASGGDGKITEFQGTANCHVGALTASVTWRSGAEATALVDSLLSAR